MNIKERKEIKLSVKKWIWLWKQMEWNIISKMNMNEENEIISITIETQKSCVE